MRFGNAPAFGQVAKNGLRQTMWQANRRAEMTDRLWGLLRGAALVAALTLPAAVAGAQSSPFAPVAYVNNRVVSAYELDQRVLFLQLLRQPGDLRAAALQALIEDRLRMEEAKRLGISVPPDAVKAGMEEFAGRANLTADKLLEILGQAGIEPQSFRDFVEAGVVWREVVRARFAPITTITDAEVDRALANYKPASVLKARLAEIVIKTTPEQRSTALAMASRLRLTIKSDAEFAAEARKVSSGPTAGRGGVRDWQRLSALPEASAAAVRRLTPGQISAPVVLDGEVVIYRMIELGEDKVSGDVGTVVDYAQFLFPAGEGSEAEAARIRARVDTCDDLYDVAKGLPADRLLRDTRAQREIPGDIAAALTLLDTGESSTSLTRGGWRVFLMLCSRTAPKEYLPTREDVRLQLLNQRLSAQADIYLEELRSEAIIREP